MRHLNLFIGSILALTVACGRKDAGPSQTATQALPSDVKTITAIADTAGMQTTTRTAAAGSLLLDGELQSPVVSEVAPRVGGRVSRVYVAEGQAVARGQRLLDLETEYQRLDLRRAEAELARARAALDEAKRDLDRKTELLGRGSVPQAVYDRSKAAYEQAQAGNAAAAAAVATARRRVNDSTLVSPLSGVVVEKRTDVGERLAENSVAFLIAQTAPLKLRFSVPERYAAQVKVGDAVTAAVDAYPGRKFTGAVGVVSRVVDPKTRSFFVDVVFPNRDAALRPGMFARVEIGA